MNENSSKPVGSSSQTVVSVGPVNLSLRGLGHVPSLKNSFHSIIKPENREWKRRAVKSLESQLLSALPTGASATVMQHSLRSLIASLPPDDNWKVISEIRITAQKVAPGEEGADITITPL